MSTNAIDRELDQLIGRFGPADEGRMILADKTAWVWTLDEPGDGIGLARSATASGLVRQVDALLGVRYRGHSLRKLVVTERMCGNRRFHERPDLLEVEQAINDGWCSWLAITNFDRISRTVEAGQLFLEYLRETKTELVVADLAADRPIDLGAPILDVHLQMAAASAAERKALASRLRAARRPLI